MNRFWIVYDSEVGPRGLHGTARYDSEREAIVEAKTAARNYRREFYVLRAVGVAEPPSKVATYKICP